MPETNEPKLFRRITTKTVEEFEPPLDDDVGAPDLDGDIDEPLEHDAIDDRGPR